MPHIRSMGIVRAQPFLYMPAISNVVNQWKQQGIFFLRNRALGFVFSILFFVYGAITVAKISVFSTLSWSTVNFYSM